MFCDTISRFGKWPELVFWWWMAMFAGSKPRRLLPQGATGYSLATMWAQIMEPMVNTQCLKIERNYLNPRVNNIWKPSSITRSNKFLFFFNNFELGCPSRDHCPLEHNGRQSLWLSDIKTAFNYFQCYFKFNPWDPVYTLLIPHFLTFLWLLQGRLFGFENFIFPDLCSHGTCISFSYYRSIDYVFIGR